MPTITSDHVGIALDMHGCPNRCRHCWLGSASGRHLTDDDLRWAVAQFRRYIESGRSPFNALSVSSWFREPDYASDYRQLHELEAELGDTPPGRYELLSIWRLARDPDYAPWAKSVGPDTCQITLFGLEQTHDWFHRRPGAFQDALTATERLLNVGMKPRWQLFLTTRLLPDLDGLLALIDRLRLRQRVADLGGEFQLFMHPPGPDGAARQIEGLRPTLEQVANLPEEILAPSRKHFGRDLLWQTEAELFATIVERGDAPSGEEAIPNHLWFHIETDWDIFANIGSLEPWWRLGNLKEDSVETIISRYENDTTPGLQSLFHQSPAELARTHGNPRGEKIYSDAGDLLALYRTEYCEQMWRKRQ
jgi:hypothetical protein